MVKDKKLLSLPFIFWSAMFVIVPLCMVFYYGLTDKSGAFTLDNILATQPPSIPRLCGKR